MLHHFLHFPIHDDDDGDDVRDGARLLHAHDVRPPHLLLRSHDVLQFRQSMMQMWQLHQS